MAKLINCKDCGNQISKNADFCPLCGAKRKRPSVILWLLVLLIGIPILINAFNTPSDNDNNYSDKETAAVTPIFNDTNSESLVEKETSNLTRPQANAVRSAKQYISISGFSKQGLIDQLSSSYGEGYDVNDATVAVDSLNIDWNEQATRSGKAYLDMTGFSCDGLIGQLSSSAGDKYTVSEATYGAKQAGACS